MDRNSKNGDSACKKETTQRSCVRLFLFSFSLPFIFRFSLYPFHISVFPLLFPVPTSDIFLYVSLVYLNFFLSCHFFFQPFSFLTLSNSLLLCPFSRSSSQNMSQKSIIQQKDYVKKKENFCGDQFKMVKVHFFLSLSFFLFPTPGGKK